MAAPGQQNSVGAMTSAWRQRPQQGGYQTTEYNPQALRYSQINQFNQGQQYGGQQPPTREGFSTQGHSGNGYGQGVPEWRTSPGERPGQRPGPQYGPPSGRGGGGGGYAPPGQGGGGGGGGGYQPQPYNYGSMPQPANPADFQGGMPGTAPQNSYYNPMPGLTTNKPTDAQIGQLDYWRSDKNQDAMAAYANYNLPQQQLQQQAAQYGMDFGEMQRRFNLQQGWQMENDQFGQQLAGRQLGLSEWQAQEAANQFGQQFGFERERNAQQFGLQNQQFGFQREQAGVQNMQQDRSFGLQSELGRGDMALKQKSLASENEWRKTQADLNREQQAGQLMQSRYAAFGRAQAPAARMSGNW